MSIVTSKYIITSNKARSKHIDYLREAFLISKSNGYSPGRIPYDETQR